MDELFLAAISSTLDALDKTTSWAVVALLATAISGIQRDKKIKVGDFEISSKYAGVVTFAILCGLNFEILRLLQNLSFLLSNVGSKLENAKIIITTHSWIFNPFAQTSGILSPFTDNLGLALLLLIWWLGYHTGFFLHQTTQRAWTGYLLSAIYLVLGLVSMILIISLIAQINEGTAIVKQVLLFIAIPIGAFGLRVFFPEKSKST
ncbi:MAG: hypothetical protein IT312_16900 [Anaerolineales bacterium]|nr:hypothetical protein [Anaerolineales bacterium]